MSTTLGEYMLPESPKILGHGAFAVVFLGVHSKTEEKVAVRKIRRQDVISSALSKELAVLEDLKSLKHKNLISLLHYEKTSENLFMVTEYCNGGDLERYWQNNGGKLSEYTIAYFLKQMASALHAMYQRNIVHRDLKPANILLSYAPTTNAQPSIKDVTFKIADFGFARVLHHGNMAVTLCGSPIYMAPEVHIEHGYSHKADLFSLGAITYQLLTGQAPFIQKSRVALADFYRKASRLIVKLPEDTDDLLADLLLRLLVKQPSHRIEFEDFFKHPFILKDLKLQRYHVVSSAVDRNPSSNKTTDLFESTKSACISINTTTLKNVTNINNNDSDDVEGVANRLKRPAPSPSPSSSSLSDNRNLLKYFISEFNQLDQNETTQLKIKTKIQNISPSNTIDNKHLKKEGRLYKQQSTQSPSHFFNDASLLSDFCVVGIDEVTKAKQFENLKAYNTTYNNEESISKTPSLSSLDSSVLKQSSIDFILPPKWSSQQESHVNRFSFRFLEKEKRNFDQINKGRDFYPQDSDNFISELFTFESKPLDPTMLMTPEDMLLVNKLDFIMELVESVLVCITNDLTPNNDIEKLKTMSYESDRKSNDREVLRLLLIALKLLVIGLTAVKQRVCFDEVSKSSHLSCLLVEMKESCANVVAMCKKYLKKLCAQSFLENNEFQYTSDNMNTDEYKKNLSNNEMMKNNDIYNYEDFKTVLNFKNMLKHVTEKMDKSKDNQNRKGKRVSSTELLLKCAYQAALKGDREERSENYDEAHKFFYVSHTIFHWILLNVSKKHELTIFTYKELVEKRMTSLRNRGFVYVKYA